MATQVNRQLGPGFFREFLTACQSKNYIKKRTRLATLFLISHDINLVHPTPTLTGVVRGVQLEQCITKLGETRTKWDVLCLGHQHDQTGEEIDLDGVKLQTLSSPLAEVHAYVMPRETLHWLLSFNLHTNMVITIRHTN